MDLEDVAGISTEVFSLLLGGEEGGSTNVPLVLVIPGSPRVGCFYKPFATKLYDLGGGNFEVVVLSHANTNLIAEVDSLTSSSLIYIFYYNFQSTTIESFKYIAYTLYICNFMNLPGILYYKIICFYIMITGLK